MSIESRTEDKLLKRAQAKLNLDAYIQMNHGLLTFTQAAALLSITSADVSERVARKELLSYTNADGTELIPGCQFHHGKPLDRLAEFIQLFDGKEGDFNVLLFLLDEIVGDGTEMSVREVLIKGASETEWLYITRAANLFFQHIAK
jgi:hypothetical protein